MAVTHDMLKKNPLHSVCFLGVCLAARQSDDGLWKLDGKVLPWLWGAYGVGLGRGLTVKIGSWIFNVARRPRRSE